MSLWIGLSLVPALMILNAFFVAAEYAIVAVRVSQVHERRQKRDSKSLAALEKLLAEPAPALATIQVCITMTNLLLGWIAEPAMSQLLELGLGPILKPLGEKVLEILSFTIGFIVITLLTVVFSELLPKAITIRHGLVIGSITALPVIGVGKVFSPLVWVMNSMANMVFKLFGLGRIEDVEKQSLTSDEIKFITTQAAADGVLSASERSLVLNALSLGKRAARDIMVSRIHVDYLDLKRKMAENFAILESQLHNQLPVCDGGMDAVFGVLRTSEFLMAYQEGDGDASVMQLIATPPVFVPQTLSVDKLLPLFMEKNTPMLFLVSEYGGVEGIVTLRDVVDELLRHDEPGT